MRYSEETVYQLLDNIKNNISVGDGILDTVNYFADYVRMGRTYEERKMILMMCYVVNVKIDELLNWSLDKVAKYIIDTNECYDEDKYIFEECYRLIRECDKDE